jgi:2-dehydro-3-deoxyphosphogluconate aldolase / (4S)-4-hydroxy-2-oxoglutarate aldolase
VRIDSEETPIRDAVTTLRTIETGRVIAILRGDVGIPDQALAEALVDAGVTAMEITMDSPDAVGRIEGLTRVMGGRLAIGAGTVRTRDQVGEAAGAGASFIVSPNRDIAVIRAAVRHGLVVCPGCFTPSEILEALDAGAQTVKLFPSQVLGPGFVRAVRGPLGDIRIVPTGGITADVVRAYREAGAWAFGVGSELVGRGVRASAGETGVVPVDLHRELDRLRDRARAFVEAAR